MRLLASHRRRLLVPFLTLASSCYSYTLVPPDGVKPGQDVRVRITAAEAAKLSEIIGRDDRVLDGRLLEQVNGQIVIGVSSVSPSTAITAVQDPGGRMFQRYALPRESLVEIEVRHLNKTRTGIAVGILAAAVSTVAITQFNHQSARNDGGKGGTQALRIPFAIPLLGH